MPGSTTLTTPSRYRLRTIRRRSALDDVVPFLLTTRIAQSVGAAHSPEMPIVVHRGDGPHMDVPVWADGTTTIQWANCQSWSWPPSAS